MPHTNGTTVDRTQTKQPRTLSFWIANVVFWLSIMAIAYVFSYFAAATVSNEPPSYGDPWVFAVAAAALAGICSLRWIVRRQ